MGHSASGVSHRPSPTSPTRCRAPLAPSTPTTPRASGRACSGRRPPMPSAGRAARWCNRRGRGGATAPRAGAASGSTPAAAPSPAAPLPSSRRRTARETAGAGRWPRTCTKGRRSATRRLRCEQRLFTPLAVNRRARLQRRLRRSTRAPTRGPPQRRGGRRRRCAERDGRETSSRETGGRRAGGDRETAGRCQRGGGELQRAAQKRARPLRPPRVGADLQLRSFDSRLPAPARPRFGQAHAHISPYLPISPHISAGARPRGAPLEKGARGGRRRGGRRVAAGAGALRPTDTLSTQ